MRTELSRRAPCGVRANGAQVASRRRRIRTALRGARRGAPAPSRPSGLRSDGRTDARQRRAGPRRVSAFVPCFLVPPAVSSGELLEGSGSSTARDAGFKGTETAKPTTRRLVTVWPARGPGPTSAPKAAGTMQAPLCWPGSDRPGPARINPTRVGPARPYRPFRV